MTTLLLLGGGATTVNAAGTQETSATINGVTYSNFAGGSGTKVGDVVSLGKKRYILTVRLKNVAAGNISATSTDAVKRITVIFSSSNFTGQI